MNSNECDGGLVRRIEKLEAKVFKDLPQSGRFDAQIRCNGRGFWQTVTADVIIGPPSFWPFREGDCPPGTFPSLKEWYGKFSEFVMRHWCPDPGEWLLNIGEIILADGRTGRFSIMQIEVNDGNWECQFSGIGELNDRQRSHSPHNGKFN